MAPSASLLATEELGGRGATHPRVALADIEASVAGENYFTIGDACDALGQPSMSAAKLLTVCVLTMTNGFVVLGKSAPASPENFDADKGRTFAREDAIRQLWPLMGFALRDRLHNDAEDRRFLAMPYDEAAALRRCGEPAVVSRLDRLQIAVDA